MNVQRAQEIAESPTLANVTFNGVRVYIQNVDENKGTARIFPIDDTENEQEVALSDLREH
ncbi:small acid-soluble spore protein H [Lysinibacillus telephonicus]|uniref:Small, acid-soluble spore protein H n=1 Tax=Lysinibacillus telephonicus TaxID=1714840 RepID=A0A431UXK1_9BACI|nr:small acid-soluble spore protein H [Lysinibacillus telephonicus]RTQ96096.1 small acid-soluble spore protein H [Lysinibacillus telephonicus]